MAISIERLRQRGDDPTHQSAFYTAQIADHTFVNDLMVGTKRLREKGKIYLPQHPGEEEENYKIRNSRAVLWNGYRRTVRGLTGLAFRKPLQLGDDVPKLLRDQAENIDMMGTHINVFAKQVLSTAINEGHTFIYVDMGKSVISGNPKATARDERLAGLRPFWVHVNKSQVINWRYSITASGVLKLTQATIVEKRVEPFGSFGEIENTYFRVLRPGSFQLFKLVANSRNNAALDEVDNGLTTLSDIPLVPVYTNKVGFMQSAPAMLDAAYLNVRLYQVYSDFCHSLHIADVPFLVAKNRDKTKKTKVISPNTLMDVDENGDIKWCELEGKALDATRVEITDLKRDLASFGISALAPKTDVSDKTATEAIFEKSESNSELDDWVTNTQDGLETAFTYHARMEGERSTNTMKEGGSVTMNREFTKYQLDPQTITALSNLVATNQISLEVLWDNLERAGILKEGFDRKKMRDAIAQDLLLAGSGGGTSEDTNKNPGDNADDEETRIAA